jgi:hypothetical protein
LPAIDRAARAWHLYVMTTGRKIGIVILSPRIGGLLSFLGGLAWTELAADSGFEGYSGFVVVYWLFAGLILGLAAGLIAAFRA